MWVKSVEMSLKSVLKESIKMTKNIELSNSLKNVIDIKNVYFQYDWYLLNRCWYLRTVFKSKVAPLRKDDNFYRHTLHKETVKNRHSEKHWPLIFLYSECTDSLKN